MALIGLIIIAVMVMALLMLGVELFRQPYQGPNLHRGDPEVRLRAAAS